MTLTFSDNEEVEGEPTVGSGHYLFPILTKGVSNMRCLCTLVLALLCLALFSAGQARADGLLANWTLNAPTGTTSFTDNSGNGHTATLQGTDTLASMSSLGYPNAPVGGGLYFNGLNGAGNCLSVPYSASFGGMYQLTLSAWVYYPATTTSANAVPSAHSTQQLFNLWNGGTNCYKFGYLLPEPNDRMGFYDTGSGSTLTQWGSCWKLFNGNGPDYTPGTWAQWTMVYNGDGMDNGANGAESAVSTCFIYQNGVLVTGGSMNLGGSNGAIITLANAANGQPLYLAGGDNEWLGALADLGMWNVALTSGNYVGDYNRGTTGGEVTALYTTPTSGYAALSQYGVKAMDQLFTLYDTKAANPAVVTTANSTLTWQYVASGLPDGSGGAGLAASGPYAGDYYVQLDGNGGGVVAPVPTPEPSTLMLLAVGLVGLLAYAWRKRK